MNTSDYPLGCIDVIDFDDNVFIAAGPKSPVPLVAEEEDDSPTDNIFGWYSDFCPSLIDQTEVVLSDMCIYRAIQKIHKDPSLWGQFIVTEEDFNLFQQFFNYVHNECSGPLLFSLFLLAFLFGVVGNVALHYLFSDKKARIYRSRDGHYLRVMARVDLIVCLVVLPYSIFFELRMINDEILCRVMELIRHTLIYSSQMMLFIYLFEINRRHSYQITKLFTFHFIPIIFYTSLTLSIPAAILFTTGHRDIAVQEKLRLCYPRVDTVDELLLCDINDVDRQEKHGIRDSLENIQILVSPQYCHLHFAFDLIPGQNKKLLDACYIAYVIINCLMYVLPIVAFLHEMAIWLANWQLERLTDEEDKELDEFLNGAFFSHEWDSVSDSEESSEATSGSSGESGISQTESLDGTNQPSTYEGSAVDPPSIQHGKKKWIKYKLTLSEKNKEKAERVGAWPYPEKPVSSKLPIHYQVTGRPASVRPQSGDVTFDKYNRVRYIPSINKNEAWYRKMRNLKRDRFHYLDEDDDTNQQQTSLGQRQDDRQDRVSDVDDGEGNNADGPIPKRDSLYAPTTSNVSHRVRRQDTFTTAKQKHTPASSTIVKMDIEIPGEYRRKKNSGGVKERAKNYWDTFRYKSYIFRKSEVHSILSSTSSAPSSKMPLSSFKPQFIGFMLLDILLVTLCGCLYFYVVYSSCVLNLIYLKSVAGFYFFSTCNDKLRTRVWALCKKIFSCKMFQKKDDPLDKTLEHDSEPPRESGTSSNKSLQQGRSGASLFEESMVEVISEQASDNVATSNASDKRSQSNASFESPRPRVSESSRQSYIPSSGQSRISQKSRDSRLQSGSMI